MERKHIITIFGMAVMVSLFVFTARAVLNSNASGSTPNSIASSSVALADGSQASVSSGKQVIQLSMQNGNYYPNTIRVKKGIPVEIVVDTSSVRGCYRSIRIPAFGVQKTVNAGDNRIEFTPDKAGTFGFSCSMGMGTGRLIVEDESGAVPSTVNTLAQDIPQGSCGAGGGCGCGAR